MSDTYDGYETGMCKILNFEKANTGRVPAGSRCQRDRGSIIPCLFGLTFQLSRCPFNLVNINIFSDPTFDLPRNHVQNTPQVNTLLARLMGFTASLSCNKCILIQKVSNSLFWKLEKAGIHAVWTLLCFLGDSRGTELCLLKKVEECVSERSRQESRATTPALPRTWTTSSCGYRFIPFPCFHFPFTQLSEKL